MFFRYIYYRLYKRQQMATPLKYESVLTAILYLSLSPTVLVVSFDMVIAYVFETNPIYEILGKWPYVITIFCFFFFIFYKTLGGTEKIRQIELEMVSRAVLDRYGNYILVIYFAAPLLFMFCLAGRLSPN